MATEYREKELTGGNVINYVLKNAYGQLLSMI